VYQVKLSPSDDSDLSSVVDIRQQEQWLAPLYCAASLLGDKRL